MKSYLVPVILVLGLFVFGCNAGNGNPVSPDESDHGQLTEASFDSPNSSRHLLSVWDVSVDPESGEVDLVPARSADFTCNIAHFLAPPVNPQLLMKITMLSGTDFNAGYLDLDISMMLPFPGLPEYKGFDTWLIFLTNGSEVSAIDPDIIYSREENLEPVLLNPDGYTRWWNYPEFTDPMPLLSFKPFALSTWPTPSATINSYKYYADGIGFDGSVADLPTENRGVFSNGYTMISRHFLIQFPVIGGTPQFRFNIAVCTSWAFPDSSGAPSYPPDSFPPEAQAQEAYNAIFDSSDSNAWYLDGDTGGSVVASVEVFDWQAPANPDGVEGEVVAIMLESPIFIAPINIKSIATISPGSQPTSAIFEATIPELELNISGIGVFPVLGRVENVDPNTYQPNIGGGENFIFPDGPLASYFMGTIEIYEGEPPVFTVTQPNGSEMWDVGTSQEIIWTGGLGITDVAIFYSKDDFVSDINTITASTPNSGSFTWDPIPNDPSVTAKVRVQDASDPGVNDDSDDYFSIIGTELEILVPNGGEIWMVDSTHEIEWTGGSGVDTVNLLYSKDDFVSDNNEIVAGIPNTGSYIWVPIPNDPSDSVMVRVEDATDPATFDDSDEYFTISDSCEFLNAPTYSSYDEFGAVMGTGFDFMKVDTDRMVACRPEDGLQESFPWVAVYEKSNLNTPLDTFQVPGFSYPSRPFSYQVDSSDRIYFFMAEDQYDLGWRGPSYMVISYIDWDGTQLDVSSYGSFDISSFMDGGEMGCQLWVDSSDNVYALSTEGKVIKFDPADSLSGTVLFDLDANPSYPEEVQVDFLLEESQNVFFIYTEYGTENRAIYKVSYDGTILLSQTNIWSGIVGGCGSATGGIGVDGDCRLIVIDGHSMIAWGCIRYDFDFTQKAYSVGEQYEPLNHPGNSMQFTEDGMIVFNAYFWQWKNFLATFTLPVDW